MSPERELNVIGSGKGLGQWGFLNFPPKLPNSHSLDALPMCLSTEPNKEWAAKKYLCKVTEERNRKGKKEERMTEREKERKGRRERGDRWGSGEGRQTIDRRKNSEAKKS